MAELLQNISKFSKLNFKNFECLFYALFAF